ncbi:hypothetical protein TCAL_03096 [Tigriopus californicus]|uniref:Uncharacterized protein n=1 Tax=Tigriopus californicus TaxID=6832 RepID=A0A553NQE8_TIGCA|nr:uncharacterized protein LOC131878703 [Tigriopus californicus]TRY67672.1 hypothetical protein TCAL_03096 [Tigriopus californicus]|eukprot:TCALIF_03096-PA protein Name:"Protein of unknown function" AED:0.10 eAED:0.10 QI:169/1/1/1/1/1/4/129/656
MLKWLVQKTPQQSKNLDLITDNPLAALEFNGGISTGKSRSKEIYSVNRTNPLYDADDGKWVNHGFRDDDPDPKLLHVEPNATRSSRTSSGYGSQDSQRRMIGTQSNPQVLGRDELTSRHEVESFAPVGRGPPKPIWPDKHQAPNIILRSTETHSNKHVPIAFLHTNSKYVSSIGMFGEKPGPHVFNVVRNGGFVSSIQFGGAKSIKRPIHPRLGPHSSKERVFGISHKQLSPIDEMQVDYETNAGMDDSIVTDSLLQLTSFSPAIANPELKGDRTGGFLGHIVEDQDDDEAIYPPSGMVRKNENMDNVIRELTQAVIKSRNRSTLTRAMGSKASGQRSSSRRTYLRNSIRAVKSISKGPGKQVMRDLWQKSGMKTNGRKLIADSLSEDESGDSQDGRSKYLKKRGRKLPKRNHSIGSSSVSSSESTLSGSYQTPFTNGPRSHAFSSGIYAEVYKSSSQNSSVRKVFDRGLVGTIADDVESISTSDSENKRVRFSGDVVNNEALKERLVYDFVPRTKPSQPQNRNDVIIDIAKLNQRDGFPSEVGGAPLWERYYGADGKFAGNPEDRNDSAKKTDYRAIFTSPYFDYRRTNSHGGTVTSKSDPLISNLVAKQTLRMQKKRPRICGYWQTIFTLLFLGSVMVTILTLTVLYASQRTES